MLWLAFLVLPLVLGFGIFAFHQVPRWGWLLLIGIIAAAEIAVIGKPSPTWEEKHVIALWALGVIFPWGVIAAFIVRAPGPYSPSRLRAAVSIPILYFFLVGAALGLGDTFGFIPH